MMCGLAAAAAATLTMAANADITMNIWDDGTDLFMSATGDYDLTRAIAFNTTNLGANAAVAPTFPLYGWETGAGTSTGYEAFYVGVLTGTVSVFPATSTTTSNPFFFWNTSNSINFMDTAPVFGSVDEFAVFQGVTLASLGMVLGETVTVSWGNGGLNERGTINTVIPAPGAMALLGVAGFVSRRRRRA